MQKPCSPRSLLSITTISLVALAGCSSSSGVTVSGKIVPPANVKLHENDSMSVNFVPSEKTGKAFQAAVSPKDMTFVCKDVQPGKYKVAVQFQAYPGSKDTEKHAESLAQLNRSFEAANTKLTYEVTKDGIQSITVDLAAGTVTKQ